MTKGVLTLLISLLFLSTTLSLSGTAVPPATILYVDDDNTEGPWDGTLEHPFLHIQDAVDTAENNTAIYVFDGLYHENLRITKTLAVVGEHREHAIIEGRDSNGIVLIEGAERVYIHNFTIQHASYAVDNNFGISTNATRHVYLTKNIIQNNDAGIVIGGGSEDCIVKGNMIRDNSIGIDLCTSDRNLIYGNTITDNAMNLLLYNSNNNVIMKNSVVNGGKNIRFYNSYDTIQNNYWGRSYVIYPIIGTITLDRLGLTIPWVKWDFQPAASSEAIESNPVACMDTSMGSMILELYHSKVPKTVNNFIKLSVTGFYDNLVFHRVIDDFVIQGGGYYANGTNKESPYGPIDLEIHPDVWHVDGAISMARTNDPNSATSQFFICDGDQHRLDDSYAAFGKVILGIDVVRDIASVETTTKYFFMKDWPVEDIVINTVDIINV
jgi:parallel beta-helix repeat protein